MEQIERLKETINRVAPSVSPIGRNDPTALSTKEGYVYRETGNSQIYDIIDCGYVRSNERRPSNQVWWTSGGKNSFHVNKKPVLVASSEIVNDFKIGAISINDLIEIWIYDDELKKWDNKIDDIRALYIEKQQKKYGAIHSSLFQEKSFTIPESISIEEVMPTLQEEGFTIFGHGTGGNNVEAVNSIFQTGLRASHTSLFYTTIGLDVGQDVEKFKEKLDHWQHLDSENIILIKLPNDFFNMIGDSSDLECERTAAFVNKVTDSKGNITYYLDPKFIVGAYNRNNGLVKLNPNFEQKLTATSLKEMEEKLKDAIAKVQARNKSFAERVDTMTRPEEVQTVTSSIPEFDMNSSFDDLNWDDEFPPLEENKGFKR